MSPDHPLLVTHAPEGLRCEGLTPCGAEDHRSLCLRRLRVEIAAAGSVTQLLEQTRGFAWALRLLSTAPLPQPDLLGGCQPPCHLLLSAGSLWAALLPSPPLVACVSCD